MKRILLTCMICCILASSSTAQDFTFSQFYEQPLLRNPALAGIFTGDLRVSMAYRDQWSSVTVPYRTAAMSIENKIPVNSHDDVLTIGAQMSVDEAGDIRLRRTQLFPAINFHKSLDPNRDTYLSLAFMGGPVSSQFDMSQLKLGDQYVNGSYSPGNSTSQVITQTGYSYWDLMTGLCFSTVLDNQVRFYVAAGLAHFTKPIIHSVTSSTASFLAPKWSLNAGTNAPVGDNGHIISFVDYYTQNGSHQLIGGLMYGRDLIKYDTEEPAAAIYFGSFLRWGDAIIPVVRLEMDHVSIGVSYDVNISSLNVASNWRGGLELTAAYKGFLKIRNSTIDRLRCTRF